MLLYSFCLAFIWALFDIHARDIREFQTDLKVNAIDTMLFSTISFDFCWSKYCFSFRSNNSIRCRTHCFIHTLCNFIYSILLFLSFNDPEMWWFFNFKWNNWIALNVYVYVSNLKWITCSNKRFFKPKIQMQFKIIKIRKKFQFKILIEWTKKMNATHTSWVIHSPVHKVLFIHQSTVGFLRWKLLLFWFLQCFNWFLSLFDFYFICYLFQV